MSKAASKTMREYYSPGLTADAVIFTVDGSKLKVVLVRRAHEPFRGQSALPGGFLRVGETTRAAAKRILRDRAGVGDVFIEQLYTFDDPERDPRGPVASVVYYALVPCELLNFDGTDIEVPVLYAVDKFPKLAFDHRKIIDYAVYRLRMKLEYTNAAFSLLPREFSFSELQAIYEAVLGRAVDKRNFRKKFMSLGLISPVPRKLIGGRQRPAQLYRFVDQKIFSLKKFF